MSESSKHATRGGASLPALILFRWIPGLLALLAISVALMKAVPLTLVAAASFVTRTFGVHHAAFLIELVKGDENWLSVITLAVAAVVLVFIGSFYRGATMRGTPENKTSAASGKSMATADRTKCAKSSCRRMRLSGKPLCIECLDEFKKQDPLACAECGGEVPQDASNPLCKLCHQAWLLNELGGGGG